MLLRCLCFCLLMLISCTGPSIKIATYNIFFLDEGIKSGRKQSLQIILQELDADIIAFQEINNKKGLQDILPANYEIAMLDDSSELQELALAVRPPFRIVSYRMAFPNAEDDDAFPRGRDLLEVEVEGLGRQYTVLVHHAKSRSGGRIQTDPRREKAAGKIVEYIRNGLKGRNVVLMGDFNDSPDDRSVNILEYGDTAAVGGIDTIEDTFLWNTSENLAEKDICSYGYSYYIKDIKARTFDPAIAGSRDENNKFRGKEHDYWKEVKIKPILLDQILISAHLKGHVLETGVYNRAIAITGERSKVKFVEGSAVYTQRGTLPSDHVPVWLKLKL